MVDVVLEVAFQNFMALLRREVAQHLAFEESDAILVLIFFLLPPKFSKR